MTIDLPDRQVAHLHGHSEYSLLDGTLSVDKILQAAKDKSIDSIALTEHGNLASAMAFYLESVKRNDGVKPIFGIEAYVVDDAKNKESKSSHLVLLAKDSVGFNNLLKLSKLSWIDNFYYKPKVDISNLRKYNEGLVALTACLGGIVNNELRYRGYEAAVKRISQLKDIFGDNLFLEIQLMEEVYGPDFKRFIRKINKIKDDNLRQEKMLFFEQNKDVYRKLFTRHVNSLEVQPDFEEKVKSIIGDDWLDQATVNKYMLMLSKETKTPYVLTGDFHYPKKGEHLLQDLMIRVGFGGYKQSRAGENEKSQSTGRGYYSSQLFIKNNEDFEKSRVKYHPYLPKKSLVKAIKNTHVIADQCNVNLSVGQHQLPVFDLKSHPLYKEGDTKSKLFRRLILKGFKKVVLPKINPKQEKEYMDRIDFEFDIIKKANFIDYFLIIEDIVRWSRNNGIFCVARGSVAGSLVACAIDITGVDPIKYNLLFERFLNPTRVSGERAKAADALPDIDLDFERNGRAKVKRYIVEKYGTDRVCTIGAYGTMGIKLLLKDAIRAFNYKINDNIYTLEEINRITGSIEINTKSVEEAVESSELFRKFYETNKEWVDSYITPLQGEIRSMSRHAAGVLITPTDFTDWVPVRSQELEDEDVKGRIVVSQWEDVYCERRGLLKLDILGVKQLDVFHKCFDLIKKRHDIELTFEDIDTHDKEVFKKFHQGDNFGVFQFNSQLQSNYMRGMLPNSVEDLCASNALLRPGPMNVGAHELFVKLKKGQEKPEYDHACVKPYVSNTQSLMIYQEQIMQVANVLGGLSLAEADMMRSSIKKKDEKSLSQFKEKFISGCRSKGLDEKHSMRVWEKILSFSAYGFNKSHSMTYALQGYYCQWLKTYFPTEFYAATLQFASDDAKKHENIYTHRQNAITEGIEIITPDINGSISTFEITKDDKIWWPIVALKGVGDKAVKSLEECRPFVSFDDFLQKINGRLVNKRVVEKLVFSGAMDKFGDRKDLLIKYAMFKKSKEGEKYNALTEIDFRKLQDETLGYISISYKQQYAASFSKHVMKCKDVSVAPLDARVCIGGLVTKLRQHKARNGMMAFMTVEDAGEVYDIVVFASVYKSYQDKDLLNKVVEIRGTKGKSFKGEQQIVLGMPNSDKIFALN